MELSSTNLLNSFAECFELLLFKHPVSILIQLRELPLHNLNSEINENGFNFHKRLFPNKC
jgi:hypothetical protein